MSEYNRENYLDEDTRNEIRNGAVAKTVKWDNGWTLELTPVNRGVEVDENDNIITGQPIPNHYYGRFVKPDSPCVYLVHATDIGGFDSPKAGWIPHVIRCYLEKPEGEKFIEERDYPFYKLHYSDSRRKLYGLLNGYK